MNLEGNENFEVELYHKDIHSKYSRLYIKMTVKNINFVKDDTCQLLKNYFLENQQPFEISKTYEVCLYPNYILSDDLKNPNEILFYQAEQIRIGLESMGINIDQIYVFGKSISENPKIVIEIEEKEEKKEKRDRNTFVLENEETYSRLLNYHKNLLLNIYLEDEKLAPKERKKLIRYINKNHVNLPSLSEEEAEEYFWAMQLIHEKDKYQIIDKKKNGYHSFHLDSKMWVGAVFSKIHDEESQKMIDQLFFDLASEKVVKIFKGLMSIQDHHMICEILDIPYTTNQKLIIKGFIDQYGGLAYVFDEESKIALNRLKTKTMEIINKYNLIEENGNEVILEKLNSNQISTDEERLL